MLARTRVNATWVIEPGDHVLIGVNRCFGERLRDMAGLEELDLPPFVAPAHRNPTLTTCQLSPAIDDMAARKQLLNEYNIEIAGGFGPLKGKIWRIGLMGHSSRRENVVLLLAAIKAITAAV